MPGNALLKEVILSNSYSTVDKRFDQINLNNGNSYSTKEIQPFSSTVEKNHSFKANCSNYETIIPPTMNPNNRKQNFFASSNPKLRDNNNWNNNGHSSKCNNQSPNNNSILALHLEAYDNSVDKEDDNTVKAVKEEISMPCYPSNPFEFPRQQEDDRMDTPEVMGFKASQKLFNPNDPSSFPSVSPQFRRPNAKTLKKIDCKIGGFVKKAADEFGKADPPSQLKMFKDVLREKLHLEEKLKQVERKLEWANKSNADSSRNEHEDKMLEDDVEMDDVSEKFVNEIGVQTIESRITEDDPCKKFEEIMKSKDTKELEHYLAQFGKRMIVIGKYFKEMKSRSHAYERVIDVYNILCHIAAPRTPLNSSEAMEHRQELCIQVASKLGLQLKVENNITPLEASFWMNECRLSMRNYLKSRDFLKDYCKMPTRYAMDKQVKEVDQIFETTVNYIDVDGGRILVTTVNNIFELIQYRIQTLIDYGNFRSMPAPWDKTIFVYIFYDKGGKHLAVKQAFGLSCSFLANDPQRITFIGAYDGDMKHMEQAFISNIEQLNRIRTVCVKINGVCTKFDIVRRFSSDTEGILQSHCRLPATSNIYCWNCDYVRPSDRRYSNPEAVKVGQLRLEFHEDDNGYVSKPYYNSKPEEISFPVLHMFQGMLNDKLNLMENILKQLDFLALSPEERAELERQLAEVDQQIKKLQLALQNDQEKFESTEAKVNMTEHLLEHHGVNGLQPNNGLDGGCAASFCAARAGYDVEEIKLCSCCNPPKSYHKYCIGFHGNKTTIQCRLVREYQRNQLDKYMRSSLTKQQESLRKLIVAVTKRKNKLEKALISKANVSGPNMQHYYRILNDMGVHRNAWFGNFNGNQARIVLTQTEKFDDLDAANTHPKIKHLITAIKKLGSLQNYTIADFLTNDQIQQLKIEIEEYVKHMVENLGDTSVTPKSHFLLHLHQNAEKYKTLGLLSEQAIEALHAYVNSIYSRAAFFDKEERDAWIMKYVWRQNIIKDQKKIE